MAHSDTVWVLWFYTREPLPTLGLQPHPMLEDPLCPLLLMLHCTKSRILQFSCSSPALDLKNIALCIHWSPVKNPNKLVLQPNGCCFLPWGWVSSCGTFTDAAQRSEATSSPGSWLRQSPCQTAFAVSYFQLMRDLLQEHEGKAPLQHFSACLYLPQDLLCSHFPGLFLFHNFLLRFTASQLQRLYLGSGKSIGKVDFYGDGSQIVFI